MSHEALSAEQFGVDDAIKTPLRVAEYRDPNAPWSHGIDSDRYMLGKPTSESIDPSRLLATQDWVSEGVLGRHDPSPIHVLRISGNDYIMDGHHRAADALHRGVPVSALVWKRGAS